MFNSFFTSLINATGGGTPPDPPPPSGPLLPPADAITFDVVPQTVKKYLAYGSLSRANNKFYQYAKNGTSHVTGKSIARLLFDADLKTVQLTEDILTVEGDNNLEGGTNAFIDGKHYICTPRRNNSGGHAGIGYYTSTDGATGLTFTNEIPITPNYALSGFYGDLFKGDGSQEWFMPWREVDNPGTQLWRENLKKSTDNGQTWSSSDITVLNGAARLGESAYIKIGVNKYISLTRLSASPFGLWQSVSSDGGFTWSEKQNTGLAASDGASNCDMCLNYDGLIDVIFMTRGTGNIYISKNNDPLTVFNDATQWNTRVRIKTITEVGTSYNPLGYPQIININDGQEGRPRQNNYLITFAKDNGNNTTDFYYGFGSI